jgi:hypothetical protein
MSIGIIPRDSRSIFPLCTWARDIATKDYNDVIETQVRSMTIHKKSEYYINPSLTAKKSGGETKLNNLMKILERFDQLGYKRSKHQVDFHKAFTSAILKQLYGNEIYSHLAKLLRDYEIDELRPDVIVCTPRRYGKTTSVALFVAAVLWTIPGFKVDIYSTGRRASSKLLALIWKMLCHLGDPKKFKHIYNQETLAIKCPYGDISICNSYPSKVQINEKKEIEENTNPISTISFELTFYSQMFSCFQNFI